jgi:hypothetical protein
MTTLVVVSDIHHAGPAELARRGFESRSIPNPWQRFLARTYRHVLWMRDPLGHVGHLEAFLAAAGEPDWVVANGDFSVDSGFIGPADEAVFETIQDCVGRLRQRFGGRLHSTLGDHELGKLNLFGGAGGLRLASYHRSTTDLGLERFWTFEVGRYRLVGITSSLVALPVFEPEALPEERAGWEELRAAHLEEIRQTFGSLRPEERVLLFVHDPTALPFLAQEPEVRQRLGQIEHTIIGHLHSSFIFGTARWLAGMPRIGFLGNTVRRHSMALRRAREWKPFNPILCPSLTGIQLLKDGGFLRLELGPAGRESVRIQRHRLPWPRTASA